MEKPSSSLSIALACLATWLAPAAHANQSGPVPGLPPLAIAATTARTSGSAGTAIARSARATPLSLDLQTPPVRSRRTATCNYCSGALMQELIRWAEQLLRRLDRVGILAPPWQTRHAFVLQTPTKSKSSGKRLELPKLAASRFAGRGYGVTAELNF